MATVVLAVGTTSANSADATAAASDRVTLMLTSASPQPDPGARIRVQFKRTDSTYTSVYDMTGPDAVTCTFQGPVTWRVVRDSQYVGTGIGVDKL